MRSTSFIIAVVAAAVLTAGLPGAWSADYDSRFIRNYPPGYYGMYYYAERFFNTEELGKKSDETYRWDRFMSRVTEVKYPFSPIPYAWDYGTGRTFNLPDYNANNWR